MKTMIDEPNDLFPDETPVEPVPTEPVTERVEEEAVEIDDDDNAAAERIALANYLSLGHLTDIKREEYDYYEMALYSIGDEQYAIGTDVQAEHACYLYCKDSAWAFRPEFLSGLTDIPEEVFQALSDKCESGNDAVIRIINKTCGMKKFVSQAIRGDGRGHFLSPYDGSEGESGNYFIYRIN